MIEERVRSCYQRESDCCIITIVQLYKIFFDYLHLSYELHFNQILIFLPPFCFFSWVLNTDQTFLDFFIHFLRHLLGQGVAKPVEKTTHNHCVGHLLCHKYVCGWVHCYRCGCTWATLIYFPSTWFFSFDVLCPRYLFWKQFYGISLHLGICLCNRFWCLLI